MSTMASRFGARIGGIRTKHHDELEPRHCDWPATVYDVRITIGAASTRFMVLAYDESQAREFAHLRYPHNQGVMDVSQIGPARQFPDFAAAITRIETPEESVARYWHWMEMP